MSKSVVKAMEAAAAFLAGFGSTLVSAAPPDDSHVVGVLSWLVTLVLLLIWGLLWLWPAHRGVRIWLFIAGCICTVVALGMGMSYVHERAQLTFWFPPDQPVSEHLGGFEMTPAAKALESDGLSAAKIVAELGGIQDIQRTWPIESISAARWYLTWQYLAMCLAIAGAVFTIGEGVLT